MEIYKDNTIIMLPDLPASFTARIRAAYYAFRMKTQPDIERVLLEIKKIQDEEAAREITLEEKRAKALGNLDGYDSSCVESIAAGTANWRLLFEHTMTLVEQLDVQDQITIVRYMFSGNRQIVREQAFRAWMARHTEALLDSFTE